MKLIFASDSFKGTLSSEKTIELLTKAAKEVFGKCECTGVMAADGGEGTTDAVIKAVGGKMVSVQVHGPLMEKRTAYFGEIDQHCAIIEMAAASGLPFVPEQQRDPRETTSYGTGELIRAALERGYTDISVAIGGSATNDGGMGCMQALGMRFLDEAGNELDGIGKNLINVAHIDASGLHPRIRETKFTVMCDVTNPLCGKDGATYTFGPQKGGTPEMLDALERGMCNYRDVIVREFGINPDELPGSGAAGGLGAAFMVFLGAVPKSGIETVLDLIDFDAYLEDASLVVTGEGRTDWQSCFGKVVQGVGKRCKKAGVPAIALVGSMGDGAEQIFEYGIDSILTTVNAVEDLDTVLASAEEKYYGGAVRMFRMIKVGMDMADKAVGPEGKIKCRINRAGE